MKDFIPLLVFVTLGPLVGGILYLSCQKLCILLFKRRFVFLKRWTSNSGGLLDVFFSSIVVMGTLFVVTLVICFIEEKTTWLK